ncbi:MAG: sn-glycerol-3-phosphate ABC transporter ATP-binding protein UgpC [Eubacteriales bacterium]|nr:sn-glycerol-3-phosphate ABC transporter ATP-binding protein UgpC [Eubacteriales bacterium]
MAGLRFKNVYKVYQGGVTAVNDFNLNVDDKEFLVLVGPSGCGKSTTLRMVAGLEEITDGEVYIGNRLVNDVAPKDRDIAMVFQNYALYPHMSVYDNMAFGLKLRKTPKEEIKRRVNEAARILGIEHLLDRRPTALSGGQKQRVALGRAIVRDPQVFLLDEPLSNLDAKLRAQMRTELSKLHQRLQTTFIYVTHDQVEAMTMASRIVVMKDGFIQQVDSPQALYEKPTNLFVAGFIGSPQMNFIKADVEEENNSIFIKFGRNAIKLAEGKAKKLEAAGYVDKHVMIGIRPEDIHDEEMFLQQMPDDVVEAKVEVVEMLGSETLLFLLIDGASGNVCAKVSSRCKARPGDVINVAIDSNKVHVFDRDTEKTVMN